VSDNVIFVNGAGDGKGVEDVIVLSTGGESNDTIKWEKDTFNNGTVTVVNFDAENGANTVTGAEYVFTVDKGANTPNGTDTLTIDLPGLLSHTFAPASSANSSDLLAAAIRTAIADELTTLGLGSAWEVASASDATVTVQQKAGYEAGVLGIGNASLTGNAASTSTVSVTTPSFVQAASSGVGADWLDFTAYGARWLGAATLGANDILDGTTGDAWDVAKDVVGAHNTTGNTSTAGNLPTRVADTDAIYKGDYKLHTGDKYITLARSANATGDKATVYEIRLWKLNGETADAYTATTVDAGHRDTYDVIGFVDLGREIDKDSGVYTTSDILSHIDYLV
jgi:hypothetical protein